MRVEVPLDGNELPERLLYAMPRVAEWMTETLPALESDGYVAGANTPLDQLDELFYRYTVGRPLAEMPPKCLRPQERGIWELRTPDLRVFGWFWRHSTFVISAIETAARCKDRGLYGGYVSQACLDRDRLDLDPPPFIEGEVDAVL